MRLSELIAAIGDENVRVQNLDHCATDIDWSANKGTKITFATEAPVTMEGLKNIGLVIWVDRGLVEQAMAQHKKETDDDAN